MNDSPSPDKSKNKESKIRVKGKSEDIEIREDRKGFFVIDIPSNPQDRGPDSEGNEKLKIILDALPDPENLDPDRLKRAFKMMDSGLIEEFDNSMKLMDSAGLENIDLSGLNTRRSEMSILAFILRSAREGAKKTKILYEANLSGRQLKNYLNYLLTAGCLEEKPAPKKGNLFFTTKKGKVFLTYWTRILSLLESRLDESKKAP
jgi:predicted transcriptional regulator